MSFSIGSSSAGMGPRSVLEHFGSNQREGEMFNREVVTRMLQYLKPYRWRMVLALFLTIVESGLTLLSPYLLKEATDNHILTGDFPGLVRIAIYLGLSFIGLHGTGIVPDDCGIRFDVIISLPSERSNRQPYPDG